MTRIERIRRAKTLRKAQSIKPARRLKVARSNKDAVLTTRERFDFGAVVQPDGDVRFRVWAPGESRVILDFPDLDVQMMEARDGGFHEVVVACEPGTRYRYRFLDGGTMPDPASRRQDGDVHGFSRVVDPAAWTWRNTRWRGLPWHQTVLYEVHVGLAGGFEGVRRKLPELAQLGITAIELMPIAEFTGARNWGYDGVLPYAPDESYGTPDELRQLIDTAHGLGVQVFLDVVYNHFGPDGNYLHERVSEFFRADVPTPWGPAIDFRRREVRAFFTENALYWLRDYRFDGLRLDAVHAIAEQDWLPELAATVHQAFDDERHVHLVLENDNNDATLLSQGFVAQWNDDAHHVLHHMLTGETDGYYAAYTDKPIHKLRRALTEGFVYQGEATAARDGAPRGSPSAHLPGTSFVFFLQNHDQTGNRAMGERLAALCTDNPDALRAAVALQLLTPHIPMIFMGEERGAIRPFLYFTDFGDPALQDAIRQGRRDEFRRFAAYSDLSEDELPDPGDAQTWSRSNPYEDPVNEDVYRFYVELLYIRKQFVSPYIRGARVEQADIVGEQSLLLRWRLDNGTVLSLYVNLGQSDCVLAPETTGVNEHGIFASQSGADYILRSGRITAQTTVATIIRTDAPEDI